MDHLQSVLNAAARLVCNSRKYDRISPLLHDLHRLRVPERIKFRLDVPVFCCRNQTAPEYLARKLQWAVEVESRRRLRSASSQRLNSDSEQLATVPSVLPRLVYGTACQPTVSLLSCRQISRGT